MSQVANCCASISQSGFAKIELPPALLDDLQFIKHAFARIDEQTKDTYCYPQETDGFLPFGSERSVATANPDLCERFCYWPGHAAKRCHPFAQSEFMHAVRRYENGIQGIVQQIMDGVCSEFDAAPMKLRESSYLQFCFYGELWPQAGRKFAQDPHEDGHLLSFIKPDTTGLVRVQGRALEPVNLRENEVAILAGSLLTKLSDSAIPAAYHAVLMPEKPTQRSAMVYFVNPNEETQCFGFMRKQPVALLEDMQDYHTGFGNHSLQLPQLGA